MVNPLLPPVPKPRHDPEMDNFVYGVDRPRPTRPSSSVGISTGLSGGGWRSALLVVVGPIVTVLVLSPLFAWAVYWANILLGPIAHWYAGLFPWQ